MENSGGLNEELSEGLRNTLRGTHRELRELRGLRPLILENSGRNSGRNLPSVVHQSSVPKVYWLGIDY